MPCRFCLVSCRNSATSLFVSKASKQHGRHKVLREGWFFSGPFKHNLETSSGDKRGRVSSHRQTRGLKPFSHGEQMLGANYPAAFALFLHIRTRLDRGTRSTALETGPRISCTPLRTRAALPALSRQVCQPVDSHPAQRTRRRQRPVCAFRIEPVKRQGAHERSERDETWPRGRFGRRRSPWRRI